VIDTASSTSAEPTASATPIDSTAAQPKRVLVIAYSQTGQLRRVMDRMLAPLYADPNISVHVEQLRPLPDYPFPWPFLRFFDAFPESAHMVAPKLAPLSLSGQEAFDLVILPWQVWFLAPSLPVTAFLQHPLAPRLLGGKPVVAVVACRNMWMQAFDKLQTLLRGTGARLLDHVVLTDPGPTLATFVTTPVWLLSGRKKGFWGMPDAGLSPAQIAAARRFGLALCDALAGGQEQGSAPLLAGLGAVRADARLYVSEKAGTRSFFLWGKLLRAVGAPGAWQRKPLLVVYILFLLVLIVTIVPISLGLQVLLRPVFKARLSRIQARYEAPSGSGVERSHLYEE